MLLAAQSPWGCTGEVGGIGRDLLLLGHPEVLLFSLAATWMETSSLRSRGSSLPSSTCSLCK